jgi:hypothetical protein
MSIEGLPMHLGFLEAQDAAHLYLRDGSLGKRKHRAPAELV